MNDLSIIYCDESGNSGPNYLDEAQPFYVLAGWVVPTDSITDVSVQLEKLRASQVQGNYTPKGPLDAGEVKSSSLLKSWQGQRKLVDLFQELAKLGCIPMYMVAEKRFCIAAKIVETFLDPAYNSAFAMRFTGETVTKIQIANDLYDHLPESTLRQFAEVYRNPTTQSLTESLEQVILDVREKINDELAAGFEGCMKGIDEIAESEIEAAKEWNGLVGTLNMPCLISFLMLVEHNAQHGGYTLAKLVHDEHAHYGHGYEQIFNNFLHAKDFAVRLPHSEVAMGKIKNIPAFEIADSRINPVMQAPDFLAGTVNYLFRKLKSGKSLTDLEKELGRFVLTPMLMAKVPKLTWPVLSDQMLAQSTKAAAELYPELKRESAAPNASARLFPPITPKPVFPPKARSSEVPRQEKFSFDPPVFVLIGRNTDSPLILPDPFSEQVEKYVVPVFSSNELAEEFNSKADGIFNEPMMIEEFGIPKLGVFVEMLDFCGRVAHAVVFDPHTEQPKWTSLHHLRDSLSASLDRVQRVIKSGAQNLVYQVHDVDGLQFASALTSSGDYVAGFLPDGKAYSGRTRQEAVDALLAAESAK